MEPVTALTHRIVMHGTLWIWHKSHHNRYGTKFELNDLFPIVFSLVAVILFVIGMENPNVRYIACGVTLYGFVYFIVHEIIIHSRFGHFGSNMRLVQYWRFGHNVHHQFQKEPYGFVIPITPKRLQKQAQENPRNLISRFGKHVENVA